jgi:flavin-dependent dehydrogenase
MACSTAAGPAGCAAARALAAGGIWTLVFERGQPGKDKPCGDVYLSAAVEQLQEQGIDAGQLTDLGGLRFDRLDMWGQESLLWSLAMAPFPGWIVPRAAADQCLRDLAAETCDLRYDSRVVAVEPEGCALWRLEVERTGKISSVIVDAVVLASGSNDGIARRHGIDGRPILGASISAYAAIDAPPAPIFQARDTCRPGYGWVFPLVSGGVNAGVCSLGSEIKHLQRTTRAYLRDWGAGADVRLRGGAQALWSGCGCRWHHPAGIVSCGDAAGLIDPLSGAGIAAALLSGHRAGNAVADFLRHDRDPAALAGYSRFVREHFGREYEPNEFRRIWAILFGL